MRSSMAVLALLLAASLPARAPAQEPSGDDLVHARLIAESPVAVTGARLTLGVTLEVAPDWHVYWANPGDAGMPVTVALKLPDGWTQGPIRWPAPERHVDPAGPLVMYVHSGQVTLLIDVQVPEGAAPGPVKITGRAEWLVCKEACLLGGADLSLGLTAARPGTMPAAPTREYRTISDARERLPLPAPASLRATWSGTEVTLEVPGATGLAFAPLDPPDAEDMARRGEAAGPRLAVRWPATARGKKVTGVLEVRRGAERESVWVALDAPP